MCHILRSTTRPFARAPLGACSRRRGTFRALALAHVRLHYYQLAVRLIDIHLCSLWQARASGSFWEDETLAYWLSWGGSCFPELFSSDDRGSFGTWVWRWLGLSLALVRRCEYPRHVSLGDPPFLRWLRARDLVLGFT